MRIKTHRIVWDEKERRSFAENIVKLEKSHPELTAGQLITAAQASFPVARRRNGISSLLAMPWLQEERISILAKTPEVLVPSPEPVATEAELLGLDRLIDHLLDRLPDLLLDRLAERLFLSKPVIPRAELVTAEPHLCMQSVVPAVKAEVTNPVPAAEPIKTPKVERLTKVLVIGMLDRQAKDLKTEVNGLLDVRTWDNGGIKRLKSLVDSSEQVFIMASKTSHSVVRAVVAAASGSKSRIKEVHGGETAMKEALVKYAVEEVK